jgi:tetratricopeptide (TPR) repeat protein
VDIWEWVHETQSRLYESGQQRLADIVDQVSTLTVRGQHEQVEALVPEGLALARAIDHPWLEVYLRHWRAQSRILHRCDASDMAEVVSLLDFAHGERTADCPQSVCATQDFCSAYGVLDGLGFGEERVAASHEALARIDPTWPCFGCISMEHADALLDLGRWDEAEKFCARQLKAGKRSAMAEVVLARADALLRLGRLPEAKSVLERLKTKSEQKSIQIDHALLKSRLYALLGNFGDAEKMLPAAEELEPGDYVKWAGIVELLVAANPARNTAGVRATLRRFCDVLRRNHSLYNHALISLAAARLAMAAGLHGLAALHLEEAMELLPQLRRPEALTRERAELAARLSLPASPAEDLEALLDSLGQDLEHDHERLFAAHAVAPQNPDLMAPLARTWQELGFIVHARRALEAFVRAQPEARVTSNELMRLLARDGDECALRTLAETAPDDMRASAHFYLGRVLIKREDWVAAARAFERTRELEDEPSDSMKRNLAYVYRHLDRPEAALTLLDDLCQGEDTDDDWERMIVATILGRYDKLRASAARLGFQFEGEGPIDDPFAYCDVQLRDTSGRNEQYRAVRISPVVARIVAMQEPGQVSRYRDEVLVDPIVLNPRPDPPDDAATEQEQTDHVPVYRGLRLLKPGNYRIYDIEGVHPGEAAVEAFRASLEGTGLVLSVRSGDQYQLTPPSRDPTRGIYLYIAVPVAVPTDEVLRIVKGALASWREPVTYRGLLRELGHDDEYERHEQIARELQL